MRVSGFILLLVGFVLCITIAWAALGFMVMSCGLVCLLVAEERKKKRQGAGKPTGPARAETLRPRPGEDARRNERIHERAKWTSIVRSDPEIRNVAEILAHYGPSYVDQLAKVYLVFNDKRLLPLILELILTSARRTTEAGRPDPGLSADLPEVGIAQHVGGGIESAEQALQFTPEAILLPSEIDFDAELQVGAPPHGPPSISGNGSRARSDNGRPLQAAAADPPIASNDLSALLAILANAR